MHKVLRAITCGSRGRSSLSAEYFAAEAGRRALTQLEEELRQDRSYENGSRTVTLNEPGVIEREPVLKTAKDMVDFIDAILSVFESILSQLPSYARSA